MHRPHIDITGALPRRRALTVALAIGLGFTGLAHGQATTGTIFGSAPTQPGATVTVTNASGTVRSVTVDASGHYSINLLPVGTYTVVLQKSGQALQTRNNVGIPAGGGTEVDFAPPNARNLAAVSVSANALPMIDVSSVNSSTVITAAQLQKLPMVHNAEAIALLSPGTVPGSGFFMGMGMGTRMGGGMNGATPVSFGGSSVSENAYYVNGFNTGDPYRNVGGFQLPYGTIDQQQTFTGGYGAKYGRSDGGVINQIGKRGTNEWHFGGQIGWLPRSLEATPDNVYYPHETVPAGYVGVDDPTLEGTLLHYRNRNKSGSTDYAVYAGGPLIKDTLYVFASAAISKAEGSNVQQGVPTQVFYSDHTSRFYGKLDWNIDQNNVFEFTALKSEMSGDNVDGSGATYDFDYDTLTTGSLIHANNVSKQTARFLIGKYTSYISDNATLSVLYGKGDFTNPVVYSYDAVLPHISDSSLKLENPAYLPDGMPITNGNGTFYRFSPKAANHTRGLRVDFTYQLGSHQLGVGIDNMTYAAADQGQMMNGPGYGWIYGEGDPALDISAGLGVGAPGGEGYYVAKYIYSVATSMSMDQKAWYVQDVWNATDTLQVNIGLRNDRFTNYNDLGVAFVDEKNQWEPRIGVSWDVNGDSTLKIYGNAGRYYLALPNSVAERAANRSTYTTEYFNYTGIDANGIPTGLTPIGGLDGAPPPGPVSATNELGQPKDARTVTATNLKAQYQDEFIVGFDKTLGSKWVYGAKLTYRKLQTAIDDVCSPDRVADKMVTMGLDPDDYKVYDPYCVLFNPGLTNDIRVARVDGNGYATVKMSRSDWGFTQGAKRKYAGVDLYLEHPFDGRWQGRIDYTFARNRGNSEGQVRSDIGQVDISKTVDWDDWHFMQYADGDLPNSRRHSLRMRGAFQVTPEWMVSGTLLVQSGTPKLCLGYYGPDHAGDPTGYGPFYHWCAGEPSPPGKAGTTPWTHRLNLGVRYTPAFAAHRLAFKLDIFNALNEQHALQTDATMDAGVGVVSSTYGSALFLESPRAVRLSVSLDY